MGGWVTCPTYHSPVLVSKPKAQGQEQQRRGGVASASLRSHRSPNSQALAPHFMEPRSRAGGVYEGRGCVELRNKKKVISILQSHWLSAGPALHTPAPLGCPGLAGFCRVCSCRGRCCASVPGWRAPSEPRAGNREPGSREPRASCRQRCCRGHLGRFPSYEHRGRRPVVSAPSPARWGAGQTVLFYFGRKGRVRRELLPRPGSLLSVSQLRPGLWKMTLCSALRIAAATARGGIRK